MDNVKTTMKNKKQDAEEHVSLKVNSRETYTVFLDKYVVKV